MVKVYIVTAGIYSDFGIEAVFSTRELAEGYMGRWPSLYQEVTEWIVDEADPYQKPGHTFYHVEMYKDGEAGSVSTGIPHVGKMEAIWPKGRPRITVHCWAKDEQHAIKIANEHRTRAIAEGRL